MKRKPITLKGRGGAEDFWKDAWLLSGLLQGLDTEARVSWGRRKDFKHPAFSPKPCECTAAEFNNVPCSISICVLHN